MSSVTLFAFKNRKQEVYSHAQAQDLVAKEPQWWCKFNGMLRRTVLAANRIKFPGHDVFRLKTTDSLDPLAIIMPCSATVAVVSDKWLVHGNVVTPTTQIHPPMPSAGGFVLNDLTLDLKLDSKTYDDWPATLWRQIGATGGTCVAMVKLAKVGWKELNGSLSVRKDDATGQVFPYQVAAVYLLFRKVSVS